MNIVHEPQIPKTQFVVGQTFNSFEEFKLELRKYEAETRQKFTIKCSQAISYANKFLRRAMNENLKYYSIYYQCIHGHGYKPKGVGLRKSRTLRMNCPAVIALRISKCGTKLQIQKIHEQHEGHNLTQDAYDHLYHHKIKKENPNETANIHPLSTASMKVPGLQSTAQVATEPEEEALEDIIKLLEEGYDCRVSILCTESNEFKALYFSTQTMRNTMHAWPEFITIDGSYRLAKRQCNVFLVLAEDSNCNSEIIGVALAADHDRDTLCFILDCLKRENATCIDLIKCFMSDKDILETNVIQIVFPDVPTHIDLFHALKAFKKDICESNLKITKEQKELALEYILKFFYCSSEVDYLEIYKEFMSSVPLSVKKYYNENWHDIRDKWITYSALNNVLNNSDQKVDLISKKLKDAMKQNSTISSFVKAFFICLNSYYTARYQSAVRYNQKRLASIYDVGSCELKYQMLLTQYAFEFVLSQIGLVDKVVIIADEDDYCTIDTSAGLITTTARECECQSYMYLRLPCRHIFAVRVFKQLAKFDTDLCDKRWTQEYYISHQPASCATAHPPNDVLQLYSCTHKRRRMYEVTDKLYNLGSSAVDGIFEHRLNVLKEIERLWKHGTEIVVQAVNFVASDTEAVKEAPSSTIVNENNTQDTSTSSENMISNINANDEYVNSLVPIKDKNDEDSECYQVQISSITMPKLKRQLTKEEIETALPTKKRKYRTNLKYELKSIVSKAKILLKCILLEPTDEMCLNILQNRYLVKESDLQTNHELINDSILDERVDIDLLEYYFEEEAFLKLRSTLETKIRDVVWKCSSCNNEIGNEESICCGGCLQWHHFVCVNLIRVPSKLWMCHRCLNK